MCVLRLRPHFTSYEALETFEIKPHDLLVPQNAPLALERLDLAADGLARAPHHVGEFLMLPAGDDHGGAITRAFLSRQSCQAPRHAGHRRDRGNPAHLVVGLAQRRNHVSDDLLLESRIETELL